MSQIINPSEPKLTITLKQGIQGSQHQCEYQNIPNPLVFLDMIRAAMQVYGELEGQKLQAALMKQLEEQGHPALNQ